MWVLIGVGGFVAGAGGSVLIERHYQRKARRAGVSLNHGYALVARLDAGLGFDDDDRLATARAHARD